MQTFALSRTLTIGTVVLLATSPAWAHYVWVTIDDKEGKHGTANIYFEGGPGPGTGEHLDPFVKRGKTWIRKPDGEAIPLKAQDFKRKTKGGEQRWLKAALPQSGPRSIDMYGKWGVYAYGKTNVLLHYYGRGIQSSNDAELSKLSRAKHMNFEIAPSPTEDGLEIQILWKGEPVEKAPVRIRGPKGFTKQLTTSKEGTVKLSKDLIAKGRYTFYSKKDFQQNGTDDGKDYSIIRHQATLVLNMP